MDVDAIPAGADFVSEVERVIAACDVVPVLIGPFWAVNRENRRRLDDPKDLVRQEVAAALEAWRKKRTHLIPVLAPSAPVPREEDLPPELQGLERINAVKLSDDYWRASIDLLLRSVDRLLAPSPSPTSPAASETAVAPPAPRTVTRPVASAPRARPPAEHFVAVAHAISRGRVTFFLGPGANLCERDLGGWQPGLSRSAPSSSELARYLAHELRFDEFLESDPVGEGLDTVADYAQTMLGQAPLYDAVRSVFAAEYSPTVVHRALARLARERHGDGGPLIATLNYDDVLERALAAEGVQHEVVSYVATGDHRGKFLHYPAGHEPIVVERANEYAGVAEDRPVILKLLGGIDRDDPERDSYVLSEEDQVSYASGGEVWRMVPVTVLAKIRQSDLLFLGISPRPRLFRAALDGLLGGWQRARAWAVHLDPDVLSRSEWRRRGAEVFDVDLVEYVDRLMGEVDGPVGAASGR
jgi:hypothetical protein